jgi:hypothetical protein
MKKNLFISMLLILTVLCSNAQKANTALSNLVSPTAINQDLLPGTDSIISLGATAKSWKNIYLKGIIYKGVNKFINTTRESTFIGIGAGNKPETPAQNYNTATGYQSLYVNTGRYNTANGNNAMHQGSGTYNTALGASALYSNTGIGNTGTGAFALYTNNTGGYNTATGYNALYNNTTGTSNTANGYSALLNTTSGNYNTATGSNALFSNNTGVNNTANGYQSLYSNTTGYNNTADGTQTLFSNTTGFQNTASGYTSLYTNTSGNNNTANGFWSLFSNSTGFSNTANGAYALRYNTTGSYNTANGFRALTSNTTGSNNAANGTDALTSNTKGNSNTATGMEALYHNTSGSGNTADGTDALFNNTTGYSNTANGFHALLSNTDGSQSTAIGYSAGSNLNNFNSTFLGYDANITTGTFFSIANSTALGAGSRVTADNQVRIGSSTVLSIGGFQNWSNISDGRYKKEVKENVPGLEFINKLKPVTYHLDITGIRTFLGEDFIVEQGKKILKERSAQEKILIEKDIKAKERVISTGFIAQDVEKAAEEMGYNFSGIDKPQNEHTLYGLRYAEFVVPLVKAVQELSKQNDELKERLAKLESLISPEQLTTNDKQTITLSNASLEQNSPNPFNQSTIIRYTLPAKFVSAQIVITDQTGKVLKQVNISTVGKGSLNVQAGSLAAGIYSYSLVTAGHLIDTKKMILTK